VRYLGLPLGTLLKAKSIWDAIFEKMDHRLTSWKRLYFSKGSRITLIKITLSNFLTYYLFLFLILVGVANRIEILQWNFLWGEVDDVLKLCLVSWSKISIMIS
jgi:hypothetical protein